MKTLLEIRKILDDIFEDFAIHVEDKSPEQLAEVFGYKEIVNDQNLFATLYDKVWSAKNKRAWVNIEYDYRVVIEKIEEE